MASVNSGSTTNMVDGSGGNGDYQEMGIGNSTGAFREATRKGKFPSDNTGPSRSQGETPGAGSIFAAMLNERPNLSNPRNRGPERASSRSGSTPVPVVEMDTRATGRVNG
jgi:hypothetical protein